MLLLPRYYVQFFNLRKIAALALLINQASLASYLKLIWKWNMVQYPFFSREEVGVKLTICKIFSAICKNFEKKKTTAKGVSVRVSFVLFFCHTLPTDNMVSFGNARRDSRKTLLFPKKSFRVLANLISLKFFIRLFRTL